MIREPWVLALLWGLAVLAVVLTLALIDTPTAVLLALIASLRRLPDAPSLPPRHRRAPSKNR
jgi:hypothetical protein